MVERLVSTISEGDEGDQGDFGGNVQTECGKQNRGSFTYPSLKGIVVSEGYKNWRLSRIREEAKMEAIMVALEGDALSWFQWSQTCKYIRG